MKCNILELRPIQILLAILIFLEVLLIATKYHIHFDTYILFVMLFLALTISSLSLRYFFLTNRSTKTYEAISRDS